MDPYENKVAIKKCEKTFNDKIWAIETLRELKIMRLLKYENVVSLKHIMMPTSKEEFKSIYTVTQLMETDLSCLMRSEL